MAIHFRPDDLIFDLEIRKNLFVVSQYYPAAVPRPKLVVSFLEETKTKDPEEKESKTQSTSPKLTKQQLEKLGDNLFDNDPANEKLYANLVEQKSNQASTQNSSEQKPHWIKRFLQSYVADPNHYQVKNNQEALDVVKYDIKKTAYHYNQKNKNGVKPEIIFENLADPHDFIKFAKRYGVAPDTKPQGTRVDAHLASKQFPIVYDTDKNYDPNKDGIRVGYNSQNYDQTLIAHYLQNVMGEFLTNAQAALDHDQTDNNDTPQHSMYHVTIEGNGNGTSNKPSSLIDTNRAMFKQASQPKGYMNNVLDWGTDAKATYDDWKRSNRFVDVSDLNKNHISLKRCAMALGYKIEESKSNRDPNKPLTSLQDFADVIAYNANDVYVTMKIFESGTYANRYAQNRQLLKEFPYLIYQQASDAGQNGNPRIKWTTSPITIRKDRMTVNSTSAKYVENVIAPYDNTKIKDKPVLDLIYPGPDTIKEHQKAGDLPPLFHGHPRNMLDYVHDLLEDEFKRDHIDQHTANQVREQYQTIRDYYQHYIGKNLNNEMDPDDDASQLPNDQNLQYYQESKKVYQHADPELEWKLVVNRQHYLVKKLNKLDVKTQKSLFGQALNPSFKVTMDNLAEVLSAMFTNSGKNPNQLLNMKLGTLHLKDHPAREFTLNDIISSVKTTFDNHNGQIKQVTLLNPKHKSTYRPLTPLKKMGQVYGRQRIVPYITPNGVYKDKHGVDLRSYAVISAGGAHGVEVQWSPFHRDNESALAKMKRVKTLINWFNQLDPIDYEEIFKTKKPDNFHVNIDNLANIISKMQPDDPFTHVKRRALPFDANHTFGEILSGSASRKKPKLRKIKQPQLFKGSKVKKDYAYTSDNKSNHEDFNSYYPSLISNLEIFKNADGQDVYTHDLYHPRLHLKGIAKLKIKTKPDGTPYTQAEIDSASLRQQSMKLLINSASGAGDATFSSRIKCNNKMIAMRIIGQLFCWYIGQSLALHEARVPSTNTDGLYTMNIAPELNNKIVTHCAHQLLLNIGPEQLPLFVSKDANNRLERSKYAVVSSARGASLTSWQGPSTENNIPHPAIVDYVLAQYLARIPDSVNKPFNKKKAEYFFAEFLMNPPKKFVHSHADTLRYFQFPIVANAKTARFAYLATPIKTDDKKHPKFKVQYLNPTNRVYLMKPSYTHQTVKMTGLKVLRPTTVKKRLNIKKIADANGTPFRDIIGEQIDTNAARIIKENIGAQAFNERFLEKTFDQHATTTANKPRDITTIKISDFPENHPAKIVNEDLHHLTDAEYQDIMKNLDLNAYLNIVQHKFELQWQNHIKTAA